MTTKSSRPSVFSDINITPLTDIFLVLLIIFMVGSKQSWWSRRRGAGPACASTFPRRREGAAGAGARLPGGRAEGRHRGGRGESDRARALKDRFQKLLQDAPDAQVIIQADAGVSHGRVVEVMENGQDRGRAAARHRHRSRRNRKVIQLRAGMPLAAAFITDSSLDRSSLFPSCE